MSQNTHIKLEPEDCIFLVNNLGVQFALQFFSTVPSPTRLVRQPRPTVTGKNCRQKEYEVNNQKVSSLYFVDIFKALFGDDDGGYVLTPTYTMGISLFRDALC